MILEMLLEQARAGEEAALVWLLVLYCNGLSHTYVTLTLQVFILQEALTHR